MDNKNKCFPVREHKMDCGSQLEKTNKTNEIMKYEDSNILKHLKILNETYSYTYSNFNKDDKVQINSINFLNKDFECEDKIQNKNIGNESSLGILKELETTISFDSNFIEFSKAIFIEFDMTVIKKELKINTTKRDTCPFAL